MRLEDFRKLVDRLAGEIPQEFLRGIGEIAVSAKRLPHPTRAEVYTMGECIPLPGADAGEIQSRVVLYHGSFEALAELQDDFDWRAEAWDTLSHELRHHLEWQARVPDLERLDEAMEHNFARQEGAPFDPLFFLDGERVGEGVYRLDDDFFIDRVVPGLPGRVRFDWHGEAYEVPVPAGLGIPCFLTLEPIEPSPPGDLVLVLRRRGGWRALFRCDQPSQGTVAPERARRLS
jgi:hypothetical protein